jgi:uncharacterized protein YjgD (DUF1641 family)
MGKKAKEHRKKVAKRNQKINEVKKKQEKFAMDYLMKLIQKEKEKGLFDNPVQPLPKIDPTSSNSTTFNGPQI